MPKLCRNYNTILVLVMPKLCRNLPDSFGSFGSFGNFGSFGISAFQQFRHYIIVLAFRVWPIEFRQATLIRIKHSCIFKGMSETAPKGLHFFPLTLTISIFKTYVIFISKSLNKLSKIIHSADPKSIISRN
jgi:hypothetical protein